MTTVRGGVVSRLGLFERLESAARVTVVSASAGSGKTYVLRSWVREGGSAKRVAWVSVQDEERDPQRFWISIAEALQEATAGLADVRG
jgi:LuxR family maltose regulon positive regulatory protein